MTIGWGKVLCQRWLHPLHEGEPLLCSENATHGCDAAVGLSVLFLSFQTFASFSFCSSEGVQICTSTDNRARTGQVLQYCPLNCTLVVLGRWHEGMKRIGERAQEQGVLGGRDGVGDDQDCC